MGQSQLNNFFVNPDLEYQNIRVDLQKRLKKSVYEEIIAFVQIKTNETMEQVWIRLRNRYDELNNLEESMPEEPTKEDQEHYLQEFFRLTDPSKISRDLQFALKLNNFENEFHDFIKKMSTQEHGEIFKRYVYPSHFFNSLRQAILHNIHMLIESLKTYTDAIGKHAILIDSINKGKKDKAFIKGGASLLGLLVGVPFAGAGVGALMGGNDESKVNNSLNKLFDSWNSYINRFNQYLKSLEDNYRLAMMMLYGGTLLRVNDQLNVYNFTFNQIALLSGQYSLTITPKEKKDTERWIRQTTDGIGKLIKQKRWKEAIKVSNKLFQIVKQRPITARAELYEGKSTLYIAHLYYYLAFQESLLEEYKNGHLDSFYDTSKKLYKELPLLIQDKDIREGFSNVGHLLFRFIKEALKRGEVDDLLVIHDYLEHVDNRMEKEGVYLGEHTNSNKEIMKEYKSLMIVESFLHNIFGSRIASTNANSKLEINLNTKQIKELIEIDAEIASPDQFTQFLKSQYKKSIWVPWRNASFSWITKHKKKVASTVIGAALFSCVFTYGGDLYNLSKNQLSNLNWLDKTEETTTTVTHMKITTEYGNVRSNPNLNSKIIYTVNQTEQFQYLNKEKADGEGITWYFIRLPDGQKGWISSKITKKIED
jgi:pterin-4a-carbinolamine dehydratase